MTSFEFDRLADSEAAALGAVLGQCFNFSPSHWQTYFPLLGLENYRVLRQRGKLIGGLGIYPMGQWFGGRSVAIGGIAAVGITPEYRGIGAAAALMTHTLKELQAKGVPLSTLYAATQRLYRRVGYEQAGNICQYAIATHSLSSLERIPIAAIAPTDRSFFQALHQQQAAATNGNLDRNPAIWQRLLQPPDATVYAYRLGSETDPAGYIVFNQHPGTGGYSLQIRDLVALTPAASRGVWTFFADHRSLAQEVVWSGPAVEPLLTLLPEQTAKVIQLERWLLRIVDLPAALTQRGYPQQVEAELHLEVRDDVLPKNSGQFILRVSQGQGEVVPGGRGELKLQIQGLAPLYSGLLTPHQLQRIGQLEATEAALSTAAQLFAGSEPWMSDHF